VRLPAKQGTSPEQTSALEESLFKISGQMSTITRNQKYFRTRENRNFSTVRSTEKRIINFSFIQIALIISMGALQVFIVRFFFQVSIARTFPSYEPRLTATTRVRGRAMYEFVFGTLKSVGICQASYTMRAGLACGVAIGTARGFRVSVAEGI
jgi:hypothetical protein